MAKKMRVKVTPTTPYNRLPTLMTLKEAAIYMDYSYMYLLKALSIGKSPIIAKKRAGKWIVPKEQFNTEIKRTFKS